MRDQARSLPHVVGTCAMGEVVDANGRLIGAQGLTVADASIIPDVPSGFTQFPTIAMVERLAERMG
jgi:choline dehydrogenase-like flavoprotein